MSDDLSLKIEIDATGAAKAAGEIGKVADATKKATEATKQNAQAVTTQTQAMKVGSVEVGKLGPAFMATAGAVGQMNQQAGRVVGTIGQMTGVIQGLSTAGLGPLGIALAAVNVVVTAGTALMADYGKEAEATKRKIDDLRRSLSDLIGEQQRQAAEEELLARVRGGRGNVQEQRGYLVSVQQQQAAARLELSQLESEAPTVASGEYGAYMARRREFEQQILRLSTEEADARRRVQEAEENARFTEENARARRLMAYEIEIAEGEGRIGGTPAAPRGGGARGAARESRGPSIEDLMGRMGARSPFERDAAALDDMLRANEEREEEATRLAVEAQKNRDLEIYETRMQAEQKITELLAEEEARRLEAAQRVDEERIASFQRAADMTAAIGSSITGVYGFIEDATTKADESEEQTMKRKLRRTAVEQGIQSVVFAAQAAAAYASGNVPSGISYTAASVLAAAAATKAGVDAGNVSIPGGGGQAGAAMRGDSRPANNNAEPVAVVVNMNGPVIAAADRAELGRQLGRIVEEGRSRYGA